MTKYDIHTVRNGPLFPVVSSIVSKVRGRDFVCKSKAYFKTRPVINVVMKSGSFSYKILLRRDYFEKY